MEIARAERCEQCHAPEWYHPSGDITDDLLPKVGHHFVPKKEAGP